jgi:ribosomal protein S18 acetylase RimI-like enzyme/queuine/archaeosine tRNA-ribosyltransferase
MTAKQQDMILPQHYQSVTIRFARKGDVEGAKQIAAKFGKELGFVNIATLREAQEKDWLLVAAEWNFETDSDEIVGFVNYRIKQDKNCTLYNIAVRKDAQRKGIGTRLLNVLKKIVHLEGGEGAYIQLKCPAELPANAFYEKHQFTQLTVEEGKKRQLKVWRYNLLRHVDLYEAIARYENTAKFFTSLTVKPDEIRNLHRLWHQHAHNYPWKYGEPNPFQRALISPIVAKKKTFAFVKEMKRTGEIQEMMFDSGGYFVQTGEISYYDLHRRLYEIYQQEDWADILVLPDNPPLSQDSVAEAEQKIRQTVEGSLKLYHDLPESLRCKTMPVVQATRSEHVDYCLRHYLDKSYNFKRIGFGSFPTSGSKNSINRLNTSALMLLRQIVHGLGKDGPKIHTFGISTPPAIYLLSLVGVHSFDSNGWMRSGGYGLVFLPFMRGYLVTFNSRRHETLNKHDFEKWKYLVDHDCPFCESFERLSKNRWYRIMHNLVVMTELETHHRIPKNEVLENLSNSYYRILKNLN